jgi:hypothetical protein
MQRAMTQPLKYDYEECAGPGGRVIERKAAELWRNLGGQLEKSTYLMWPPSTRSRGK